MRIIVLVLVLLCGCSGGDSQSGIRIGYDPNWYPVDFEKETSYVNGYTEDLLLEIATSSGMEFELITANWDNLFDGLAAAKYDAVITTLPPYEYNLAKYDFSENVLDLGPVLVIPYKGTKRTLKELHGECVGIIANDPAVLILAEHPSLIIRSYNSVPDLLNAIVDGDIEGALLNHIPAANYVGNLYANALEIVGKPMTKDGVHFVSAKGKMKGLNKSVEALRKKRVFSEIQKKWFSFK